MNKLKQFKKERNAKDKAWRQSCLQRDNHECVICGSKIRPNVHHIIPRVNKEFRNDVNNGIVLCPRHHRFSFEFSAHQNPFVFYLWMMENRKEQFEYLEEKISNKNKPLESCVMK